MSDRWHTQPVGQLFKVVFLLVASRGFIAWPKRQRRGTGPMLRGFIGALLRKYHHVVWGQAIKCQSWARGVGLSRRCGFWAALGRARPVAADVRSRDTARLKRFQNGRPRCR